LIDYFLKEYSPYETLRPGKHEIYPKFPWAEIGSGEMGLIRVWGELNITIAC